MPRVSRHLLRQLRLSATSSEVPVEGEVVLEVQLVELILGGALQQLVERVEVVLAILQTFHQSTYDISQSN